MSYINRHSLRSFSSELVKISASIGIRKLVKTVGRYVDGKQGRDKVMTSTLGDATVGTTVLRNRASNGENQVAMLRVNPHFQRMGMAPKMLGDSAKQMKSGRLWGDYHFSDGGKAAADKAIKKDFTRRQSGKGGITHPVPLSSPMLKSGPHPNSLWSTKEKSPYYLKQIPSGSPRPKKDLFEDGGSATHMGGKKGKADMKYAEKEWAGIEAGERRRPSPESIRKAIADSGIKRKPMPKPRASRPSIPDPRLGNMDAAHTPKALNYHQLMQKRVSDSKQQQQFKAAEQARAAAVAAKKVDLTEAQKLQRKDRLDQLRDKYYGKHKKWVGKPSRVRKAEEEYRTAWE